MFDYFPHLCKYILQCLVYLISFPCVFIFNWQLAMFILFVSFYIVIFNMLCVLFP